MLCQLSYRHRNAGGSRTHFKRLCRPLPNRLAPALNIVIASVFTADSVGLESSICNEYLRCPPCSESCTRPHQNGLLCFRTATTAEGEGVEPPRACASAVFKTAAVSNRLDLPKAGKTRVEPLTSPLPPYPQSTVRESNPPDEFGKLGPSR